MRENKNRKILHVIILRVRTDRNIIKRKKGKKMKN